MNLKKSLPLFVFPLIVKAVNAHCPLCTAGAAAAAGGAAWLGVNNAAIGVFIGAFAVSMGWWISSLIKKRYMPFQRQSIIAISFATTVPPLMPVMKGIYPVLISIAGDYGSLLNRTYLINAFLMGSIIGAFIVSITPWLSKKITDACKGKTLPYQGITLTFGLLAIAGISLQILIKTVY